jgi:(p)ppGpp synthase/HD superfamily hydrolase
MFMSTPVLEDAIILAVEAHRGQKDRAGEPYIMHPIRVMTRMKTEEERIVAILHDVVEDTEVTLDQFRQRGYPESVVDAVEALSKKVDRCAAGTGFYDSEGKEKYSHAIRRVKENPLATKVKLSDLLDNSDLGRLPAVMPEDLKRLDRYNRAMQYLLGRQDARILVD